MAKKEAKRLVQKEDYQKTEGILSILAAFLVLFSALIEPIASIILSAALMVGFAVFKLTKSN